MNTSPLTPAHAAFLAKRAAARSVRDPAKATHCGCSNPERVGDGKTTRVFLAESIVDLCRGCALDRAKEAWAPSWAPRNATEDLARKDFNRGTEAIK